MRLTAASLDWLDRREYPFQSRYHETTSGRLHYVDEGRGPTILMVHGNPSWSFVYRNVIKGLSGSARCVAVDHLGFGLSDKPKGADHSPRAHAERLRDLVDTLGLRDVVIMVQDWGGPIGLSYALARPDNVRGVIIMNSWMWPVEGDPHYERFSKLMGGPLGRFAIRRLNFFVNGVMPRAVADAKRSLPPHVRRHYRRALPDADSRDACAALPRHILASTAWLTELWEERAVLEKLPALILWGEKDIAFRAQELARWREALPHAEVHTFPDAGHYVQEEKSDDVARLTRAWLAKC